MAEGRPVAAAVRAAAVGGGGGRRGRTRQNPQIRDRQRYGDPAAHHQCLLPFGGAEPRGQVVGARPQRPLPAIAGRNS